jgi:hypothetical protein
MKWAISFLFVLIFLISGCNRKIVLPNAYEKPMIMFGHGGGFSGVEKNFVLQTDGNLFEKSFNKEEYTHLNKLNAKDCTQFFDNYKSLGLGELQFNKPENIYYFIEFKSGDNPRRITWGDSYKENQNLSIFYRTLMHLTKTENPK